MILINYNNNLKNGKLKMKFNIHYQNHFIFGLLKTIILNQ